MEWRFVIHQQASEFYNAEAVRKLIEVRMVGPDTLAWSAGLPDWKPLRDIPELAAMLPKTAESAAPPDHPPIPAAAAAASIGPAGAPPVPPGTPPPVSTLPSAAGVGGNPWEDRAKAFVFWFFRPWKGRPSKVRAFVEENPRRAIPVAVAVIVGLLVLLSIALEPFESESGGGGGGGYGGGGAMMGARGGGNTMQNWNIMRDAQRHNDAVIDDVYRYNRDSFDQQSETYRRANYDWYNKGD
jgi:hypothetical protein